MKQAKKNPDKNGFFRWTVEIEVHETWVEDGFELTDERAHAMLCNELGYAYGHELKARVLTAPKKSEIQKAQGYTDERTPAGPPIP
jgi:hypothetical protein